MDKKQYQFKVTITLEEGDDYSQEDVKEIVEDYLNLGCDSNLIGSNSYDSCKVESKKMINYG